MSYEYDLLSVEVTGRLAEVTISNPPINVMTQALYLELMRLSAELAADPELTVVLLKSSDPDFFIAHFDVELILSFPLDPPAERAQELTPFHQMCERFRTMDKVTIAQIEGRVGGGGSELAASCDMRFGARGRTVINQMEVPLGILPGGSGTQRLPRLVGRGRALEIVLAADDLDAATATEWGYLNRCYGADEIDAAVGQLARRIASFPAPAVRLAKQSVDGFERPIEEGLRDEAYLFQRLLRTEEAQANMRRFLAIGGQTREGERRVNELAAELGQQP